MKKDTPTTYMLTTKTIINSLTKDEVKNIQLELLDEFCSFCKKNGLRYYLAYGSLLGAVRHKGFIPWDDDIDVWMPRKDYNMFFQRYYSDSYIASIPETDRKYILPYGKLQKKNISLLNYKKKTTPFLLGIDIIPLDFQPSDLSIANKKALKISSECRRSLGLLRNCLFAKPSSIFRQIANYIGLIAFKVGLLNRLAKAFSKKSSYYKQESDCIGVTCSINEGKFYCFSVKCFGDGEETVFEGKKYIIPAKYQEVLNILYGDYMKLPPIEKRVSTHVEDYVDL